jgi:6-pyruvoyltetrahydropterin/6-carboxytetrahydropterin synthase
MIEVMVVREFQFESAHHLPGYNGKCQYPHGHSYKLRIGVTGFVARTSGMVMDFVDLKSIVNQQIVEVLDHKNLNEITNNNFPDHMPTAENMVLWIHEVLTEYLEENYMGLRVSLIDLNETANSYASWRE